MKKRFEKDAREKEARFYRKMNIKKNKKLPASPNDKKTEVPAKEQQ